MTFKINDIIKVVALCLIALAVMGCEDMEPMVSGPMDSNRPNYGIISTPKKTITIKRKKPTINNPSPRPLSANYVAEIEEYDEFEEYE